MATRKQQCFWCGADLGEYAGTYGEIECCGAAECERELRAAYREQQAERRDRAEEDDYERY